MFKPLSLHKIHCLIWPLFVSAALLVPVSARSATSSDGTLTDQAISKDELRLATIGYRLAIANAGACAIPDTMTGLILHDLSDYDANFRDEVAKSYGLTYGFGVLSRVPGSNADKAGFLTGDEIISINSQDLRRFFNEHKSSYGSYNRTEHFEELLSNALKRGPVSVTIRRAGVYLHLILQGQLGCGGNVSIDLSPQINAWSDGQNVAVTRRLVRFAASDDELAFVIAHEMAHNILNHYVKMSAMSALLAEFGIGAGRVKKCEEAADSYAVGMLARANYDLTAPERFLRRSERVRWLDLPITHPGVSSRVAIVDDAIREQKLHQRPDAR